MQEVTVRGRMPAMPQHAVDLLVDNRNDALPSRLAWDGDGRGLPHESSIGLRSAGDRTVIAHTDRVTLPGRAQQLARWSIANIVLRLQLRNFRRVLER